MRVIRLIFALLVAHALAAPFVPLDVEVERGTGEPSNRVVRRFASAETAQEFARLRGLTYEGPAHPGSPFFVFHTHEHSAMRSEAGEPLEMEPIVKRFPRRVPDPEAAHFRREVLGEERQWNLHYESFYGTHRAHINAREAWQMGYTGNGIKVLIVDDGVQADHKDIEGAVIASCSGSMIPNDPTPSDFEPAKDARGHIDEWHGTACASIIAGRNDSEQLCGVGVAYESNLCARKILDGRHEVVDSKEALAFDCASCDVMSVSYGPDDEAQTFGGPGQSAQYALYRMATEARRGLGVSIFWAGGNGGDTYISDTANADGYANSIYVNAVAAVTDARTVAYYSEPGENIMFAAPSSGGTNGIYCAYASGTKKECIGQMGGTSAAAPELAGLAALVLSAVPTLTVRQMQHVLVLSTQERMKDEAIYSRDHADGGFFLGRNRDKFPWVVSKSGLAHSALIGFGIPDAARAIRMAKRTDMYWKNLPVLHASDKAIRVGDGQLPAGNTLIFDATMDETRELVFLERVQLHVSLDAPSQIKTIRIEIESPGGTKSAVWAETKHPQTSMRWVFSSVKFWNERVAGSWKVRVINTGGMRAALHSLKLTFHGFANILTGRGDGLLHDPIFVPGQTTSDMQELL